MKILKAIAVTVFFISGFLFVWMAVQAGFEVLPQVSSFLECIQTLAGMAALLFYGGLCNWLGIRIVR